MYKSLDHSFEMSWGEMALGILDEMKNSEIGKKFPRLGTILNSVRRKVLNVAEDHKIDSLLVEVQQFVGESVAELRLSSNEQARLDAENLVGAIGEVRRKLIFLEDYFDFQVAHLEKKFNAGEDLTLGGIVDFNGLHPAYKKTSVNFRNSVRRDFACEYDQLAERMDFPVIDMKDVLGTRVKVAFELWRVYNKINGLALGNRQYLEGSRLPLIDQTIYNYKHYAVAYNSYMEAVKRVIVKGEKVENETEFERQKRESIQDGKKLRSIRKILLKYLPVSELPDDNVLLSLDDQVLKERIACLIERAVPVTAIIFDNEGFRRQFGSKARERELELAEAAKVRLRELGYPFEDMPGIISKPYSPVTILERVNLILALGAKVRVTWLRLSTEKLRVVAENSLAEKADKKNTEQQFYEFLEARNLLPVPDNIRRCVSFSSIMRMIIDIEARGMVFTPGCWYLLSQKEDLRNQLIMSAWKRSTKEKRHDELAELYKFDKCFMPDRLKIIEPDNLRVLCKIAKRAGHSLDGHWVGLGRLQAAAFRERLRSDLKTANRDLTVLEVEWLRCMSLVASLKQRGFTSYRNIELEVLVEEATTDELEQMKNGGAMPALRAVAYRVEKRKRLEELLRKHCFDYSDMDYFGASLDKTEMVIDGIEELDRLKIPVTKEILYSMDGFVARAVDLDSDDALTAEQQDMVVYLQNVGCDILWARRLAKDAESLDELRVKVVHFQKVELDPLEFGKSRFELSDFQEILDKSLFYIKNYGVRILKSKLKAAAEMPRVETKLDRVFVARLQSSDLLTHEQEIKLAKFKDQGNTEAVEILLRKNAGLVRKFANVYLWTGIGMNDLIQEGNKGLVIAIQKFEWQRGYRLCTFAGWWIRQAISRYVDANMKNVRLPLELDAKARLCNKVIADFSAENFRDPTDEELMGLLSVDADELEVLKVAAAVKKRSEVSFDAPLGQDDDKSRTRLDIIGAEGSLHQQFEVALDREKLFAKLHPLIVTHFGETHAPRAWDILLSSFGFVDDEMTFLELGEKYGVSKARIGQIAKVLKRVIESQPEVVAMLKLAVN